MLFMVARLGLCELQRICYCETAGAHRITGVGGFSIFQKFSAKFLVRVHLFSYFK